MKCPICKAEVDPHSSQTPNSPYPFCSDRCKLVDLGRWLSGKYQIPIEEEDEPGPTAPDQIIDPDE
jgi:hypothetical protein